MRLASCSERAENCRRASEGLLGGTILRAARGMRSRQGLGVSGRQACVPGVRQVCSMAYIGLHGPANSRRRMSDGPNHRGGCSAPHDDAVCRGHDRTWTFEATLTPGRNVQHWQASLQAPSVHRATTASSARPTNSGRGPETVPLPGDTVVKKSSRPHPVSANNPCPFLRALVATGRLSDDREPLAKVVAVVAATARAAMAPCAAAPGGPSPSARWRTDWAPVAALIPSGTACS